ncbi:hypothetical protein LZ30DRAFT_326830 [Colletotrichum cereale]|nr:hypothetical protein LZ30DRAFT_326830 [Colletotrichum cereale]
MGTTSFVSQPACLYDPRREACRNDTILISRLVAGDTTYLAIWSIIEPGIGISAACAPALCPIARRLFGNGQRHERRRGIWRTRPLPTINVTIPSSKNPSRPMESRDGTISIDKPRQPRGNSTYEHRTSQPWPRTRYLPTRTWPSGAFTQRQGLVFAPSVSSQLACTASLVPSSGLVSKPVPSRTARVRNIQSSDEVEIWTKESMMMSPHEGTNWGSWTVTEMEGATVRQLLPRPGGLLSTTIDYDIESGDLHSPATRRIPPV